MIEGKQLKAVLLERSLDFVPPLIRDSLFTETSLAQDYGITMDAVVSIGNPSVAFRRSKLISAVRRAASRRGGKGESLDDESGSKWNLTVLKDKNRPGVKIHTGNRTIRVDALLLLADNRSLRKRFLLAESERLNLPAEARRNWNRLSAQRPLSDDEIDIFLNDCSETPVFVSELIAEYLARSRMSIDVLVPKSVTYYERLIGCVDGQNSIKTYMEEVAEKHIRQLLAWNSLKGLRHALLLGSHSLVADVLAKLNVDAQILDSALVWAANVDVLSKVTLFELCLERPDDGPTIGRSVHELVASICLQSPQEKYDQFDVLSVAFRLVYGELGRRGFLDGKPVYWARLAAFAQAAIIARCIASTSHDLTKLIEWMQSVQKPHYVLQCLVDLRTAPRWLSNFALSDQLRQELFGRMITRAVQRENAVNALKLHEMILGNEAASLKRRLISLLAFLPGPLEGNAEPQESQDPNVLEEIRNALRSTSASISSFKQLASAALFFKLPEDVIELAADALRDARYRIDVEGEPEQLSICLFGLAAVAASMRSHRLADEVFTVVRNYLRSYRNELNLDAAMQAGLIACASRTDLQEWCKCVGVLVSDLGASELSREEAANLYTSVVLLCEIVPELWAKCGQGLAAIEACAVS